MEAEGGGNRRKGRGKNGWRGRGRDVAPQTFRPNSAHGYRYSATLLDSSSYALTKFTGSKLNNFVIVKLSLRDTARVYVLFILLYPCFVPFFYKM